MDFDLVVAADKKRGIGKDGKLPWHLPGDLKYFRKLTSTTKSPTYQNAVIMGRKTWESIPEKHRPLSNRLNIIMTRDKTYQVPSGVLKVSSLDEALQLIQDFPVERCFVIGGGEIYNQSLKHKHCREIFLTEVAGEFDCDTFLPDVEKDFATVFTSQKQTENNLSYYWKILRRENN